MISERMTALRRTRREARRIFAWRVRPGDLVHAPSAVLEVLAIDNSGAGRPGYATFTVSALVVTEDVLGRERRQTLYWRPGAELLVTRP